LMISRRRKRTETATTAEPVAPPASPGTAVYGEFLEKELAAQDARKSSFEQRGLAVVTTAGTLVTLLFGLAALSTTVQKSQELSTDEKAWLKAALVLFVVSAITALLTNVPIPYEAVPAEDIKARLKQKPIRDADAARRDIALTQVKVLKDAKRKNTVKGWLLFVALSAEVIAIGFVGVAISEIISR
jgi:hypothetical protein